MQHEQFRNEFIIKDNDIQRYVARLIGEALHVSGMDFTESTKDTPNRIAKMWLNEMNMQMTKESLLELQSKMTIFPNETCNDQPIVIEGEFTSFCEHHLLPFYGKFRVSYSPKDVIIGLSKIPRVVDFFSSRPQLQERLAKDIGLFLEEILDPNMIVVELYDVVHTCVKCRGIKYDTTTTTVYTKHR